MRSIITLSLPATVKRRMDTMAVRYKTNRSQIIHEAIDDYLTRKEFQRLRQRLLKKAQKQNVFTDEDVFSRVS